MAFELALTNLVLELSLIMIAVLGWQFMVAQAIAALIMVAILVLLLPSECERKMHKTDERLH
jgi:hypothetical protein